MESHDLTLREAVLAQLDAAYAALHAARIGVETAANMLQVADDTDDNDLISPEDASRPPTPAEVAALAHNHAACRAEAHLPAGVMGNAGRVFCQRYEVFVNSDGSEELTNV